MTKSANMAMVPPAPPPPDADSDCIVPTAPFAKIDCDHNSRSDTTLFAYSQHNCICGTTRRTPYTFTVAEWMAMTPPPAPPPLSSWELVGRGPPPLPKSTGRLMTSLMPPARHAGPEMGAPLPPLPP
jgi:hypothetical protein